MNPPSTPPPTIDSPSHPGSAMRLRGLIRKELLQVARDPSSIGIALVLPVILLLLFGYGVSLDARHISIAIVDEQPGEATERLIARFSGSEYFRPVVLRNMEEAVEAMNHRHVSAIVRIRSSFAQQVDLAQEAHVQLIVDAVDANTARLIEGYVQGVQGRWLASEAAARGQPWRPPVAVEQRVWFNAEIRSRNFLVPGVVAIVMTLIGSLLTALVMAREWERGTMEALMVTPVRMSEVLLGKLVPYFGLGMAGMGLSIAMAVWLFQVPLRGSLWILLGSGAVFLLAALGMGLLISILARNQFVAAQVAILATFLPAFILSGFIFDIGSMPWFVQWITHLIPARYFVAILHTEFLAGDVRAVIVPNLLALGCMAALLLGLARLRLRKSLE